jgi:hypothetical protein
MKVAIVVVLADVDLEQDVAQFEQIVVQRLPGRPRHPDRRLLGAWHHRLDLGGAHRLRQLGDQL